MRHILLYALCAAPMLCGAGTTLSGSESHSSKCVCPPPPGQYRCCKNKFPKMKGCFGKTELALPSDSKTQIALPTTADAYPYIVPLTAPEHSSKMLFSLYDGAHFEILKEGRYEVEYSLKTWSTYGSETVTGQLGVAVQVMHENGSTETFGETSLIPLQPKQQQGSYDTVAFGSHHFVLQLAKRDRVRLVVQRVPHTEEAPIPFFFDGVAEGANSANPEQVAHLRLRLLPEKKGFFENCKKHK